MRHGDQVLGARALRVAPGVVHLHHPQPGQRWGRPLIDDFSNRCHIHSSLGGTLAIDCVPHQAAWTRAV